MAKFTLKADTKDAQKKLKDLRKEIDKLDKDAAKKREIQIFTTQQTMPVTQETIEKMAPTVGKAGGSVIDGVAPALGNLGKEISKGIKEGIKDEENKEEK